MPTTVLPDPPGADDAFYVGYDPPMPPPIAHVVRRAVWLAVAIGVSAVALVAARHRAIAGGVFEFGNVQPVTGVVVERPYPALRPKDGRPAALLVATGKHGAAALVAGRDGRFVTIEGQRIVRDGGEMIEVQRVGGGDERAVPPRPAAPQSTVGDAVTLRGEIVDSKCFLGVMVPGQGKTHRACASLCLRGGIPPALFVEDRAGESRLVLLVSPDGDAMDPAIVADRAFEATEMAGSLSRADGWWVLRTDPATWRRIAN